MSSTEESPQKPGAARMMRRFWPRHFLTQVALLTSSMLALGIIALTAYTTTELLDQRYRDTEQKLGAIANNLAFGSAHALLVNDQAALEQLLLRAADYPDVRSIVITSPNHRVLSEVRHLPDQTPEALFNYGTLSPPRDSGTQYDWQYGAHGRGAWLAMGLDATALVVWHPIENARLGWLRIEIAVDDIREDALHLIRDSVLIALSVILIGALITYLLLRPSLRAMAEATAFAGRLAQAKGQHITTFNGSAELAELGNALNETSARMLAQETARQLAERELRENETRMRFMLETCPTAARIARSGHEVIFYNSRYAELINAAPGKVSGVDPARYYAHREDYEDILQRLNQGEQVFDRLIELDIPGAGTKWAIGSYLPIQYEGQTAVLGWFHDVTREKLTEAALRTSRENLQRLLDAMAEGAYGVDTQGYCTFVNPAFLKILGFASADDVLGKHVHELIHHTRADGSPYPATDCKIYRAYRAHQTVHVTDEVFWRADGVAIPVEYWSSPILVNGEVAGAICTFTDITERQRVERMKSEFVSTVSHELRTPLTSISGALGLIAGGALGDMPAQARQMIDIAYKNSQRLSFLINDLLDMEKLVAGKMHFDLKPQALMPLIEQALETIHTYGAERGVTLALTDAVPDAEVRVDHQRLMQVMSNLLSNAIKYSHAGGSVEVAVTVRDQAVRVTVTDHGSGIPAAFHERIFQKFSQADSSDTRQKGGTGLGLAISREIVERMGGHIDFTSTEGQGARFFFDLPLWRAHEANPVIDPLAPHPGGAPRVLVVEDEPDIAQLLGLMLTRAGYAVDIAHHGTEALRALQQTQYAAMALDLMLPDLSGLDIIHQVRRRAETAALPIVVVSAKMDEGRLALSGDTADIDWLSKPIDEAQLLAALERRTSGKRGQRPSILHVEDDADLRQVMQAALSAHYDFDTAGTLNEARRRIAHKTFDVVLLDLGLPDGSGWALLPEIRARLPRAQVVVLSGADIGPDALRSVEAALLKSQLSATALIDLLHQRIRETRAPAR